MPDVIAAPVDPAIETESVELPAFEAATIAPAPKQPAAPPPPVKPPPFAPQRNLEQAKPEAAKTESKSEPGEAPKPAKPDPQPVPAPMERPQAAPLIAAPRTIRTTQIRYPRTAPVTDFPVAPRAKQPTTPAPATPARNIQPSSTEPVSGRRPRPAMPESPHIPVASPVKLPARTPDARRKEAANAVPAMPPPKAQSTTAPAASLSAPPALAAVSRKNEMRLSIGRIEVQVNNRMPAAPPPARPMVAPRGVNLAARFLDRFSMRPQ
jgi:hypothetical protein